MSVRYGVERGVPARTLVAGLSMATASLGAGVIHAAVVPEHLEETWLFGGFFIACAVFQFVWAVVVVGSPSPGVYRLGMVANGAMVAVWAVSRTTGLPVGPDPWMPEALGALDLLATGLEIVLIAVGAWALSATSPTDCIGR